MNAESSDFTLKRKRSASELPIEHETTPVRSHEVGRNSEARYSRIASITSLPSSDSSDMTASASSDKPKPIRPQRETPCPRCESRDTKFCYFNNGNASQLRYFCKGCLRYWTVGGVLRNIPPGAGKRKSKGSSGSERRTCSQNTPFQKPQQFVRNEAHKQLLPSFPQPFPPMPEAGLPQMVMDNEQIRMAMSLLPAFKMPCIGLPNGLVSPYGPPPMMMMPSGGVNLAGAIGRGMSFNLPEIAMIADPWQSQPIGFTSYFGCLPTGAAGADETGMYSQPSSGAVGQTFAGQPDCQERQQQQQQQQQHQHQQQQQQQQHMPTTMLALQMATAQAHLQQAIAIQAVAVQCGGMYPDALTLAAPPMWPFVISQGSANPVQPQPSTPAVPDTFGCSSVPQGPIGSDHSSGASASSRWSHDQSVAATPAAKYLPNRDVTKGCASGDVTKNVLSSSMSSPAVTPPATRLPSRRDVGQCSTTSATLNWPLLNGISNSNFAAGNSCPAVDPKVMTTALGSAVALHPHLQLHSQGNQL